ncbi:MAG TPA: hypothetical protein VG797_06635 [Phycisphaerales bacterium]|nr:hypothetical protein [Phycisphaerales bacterium]
MNQPRRRMIPALAALLCMALGMALAPLSRPALAQAQGESEAQLLENFNHYVRVANYELAKSYATAILDRSLEPRRFVGIVEESPTMIERFERATHQAMLVPELADVAARLDRLYEDGKLSRSRDPDEIDRNIAMLVTTNRGRLLGTDRLKAAGGYAVPNLLNVLQKHPGPELEAEAQRVLVALGSHAVMPLCAALTGLDESVQEAVARVLGQIPYRWSLPYLYEAHARASANQTKAAIRLAIEKLDGAFQPSSSVAGMYRELADDYSREPASLTMFPGEPFQILWRFKPETGLQPIAIRSEVYHQARTMELTEHALRLDPNDSPSVALWIAANLSREINQPADYANPVYGTDRRDAMYYAVAAGPESIQQVLGRAIASRDTRLVRRAIEALSLTAGGSGVLRGTDGRNALVEALGYPDRRVQYEAALVLGKANPRESFDGADRVVPILSAAIRDADRRYAVVVSTRLETQQELRAALEKSGYVVLPPGVSLADTASAVSEVSGIDLIVMGLNAASTVETVTEVRRSPRLAAVPVLALLSPGGIAQHGGDLAGDRLTMVVREGVNAEQIAEASSQLVEKTSGPAVSSGEGQGYASFALNTLLEIAVSGGVYDIRDATVPLIESLRDAPMMKRLQITAVLAYIGDRRAQQAIVDSAMNATGDERLPLLAKAIDSAKRFGDLLEARHRKWVVRLAQEGNNEEATSAAALMGALNLASAEIVPLIIGR